MYEARIPIVSKVPTISDSRLLSSVQSSALMITGSGEVFVWYLFSWYCQVYRACNLLGNSSLSFRDLNKNAIRTLNSHRALPKLYS